MGDLCVPLFQETTMQCFSVRMNVNPKQIAELRKIGARSLVCRLVV